MSFSCLQEVHIIIRKTLNTCILYSIGNVTRKFVANGEVDGSFKCLEIWEYVLRGEKKGESDRDKANGVELELDWEKIMMDKKRKRDNRMNKSHFGIGPQ